jgi:8-oxo-dGTP pyrophosphatase MutT (NUDIX family)
LGDARGGVEDGEDDREVLARELAEEVGLHGPAIGPLIWTRTQIARMSTGHDGQHENFYLVRTARVAGSRRHRRSPAT